MRKTISFLLLLFSAHSALAGNPERPIINGPTEVIAGSSPDNSFSLLTGQIDLATHSIKLSAYMLRSVFITDHLVDAAKRHVKVEILLDGWTVARPKAEPIDQQELYNADRIVKAGGKVTYLASRSGLRDDRRFRFLHSKYLVIDGQTVFISSENFANSGYQQSRTVGSRGWMIAIRNRDFAALYEKIFEQDSSKVPQFNDLVSYGKDPLYTLSDKSFSPDRSTEKGTYLPNDPQKSSGNMVLERVVSPDDTLETSRSIIGAIKKAKETLVIENLSFSPHWGPEADTIENDPSPVAEAVLSAARRGVRVRVLLTPPIFLNPSKQNTDPEQNDDQKAQNFNTLADFEAGLESLWDMYGSFPGLVADEAQQDAPKQNTPAKKKPSSRDNAALISYFRKTASKENLDLEASMFYVKEDGIRILHNKGMVVDQKTALISSVNWVENSMKNNREVGALVTDKLVAAHYQKLFELDWKYFRQSK